MKKALLILSLFISNTADTNVTSQELNKVYERKLIR